MTLKYLFKRELKKAIKQGFDHTECNCLCGCTTRKVVLSRAEAEAGKQTWDIFMKDKLWNDDKFGQGWMFGSPKTMLNFGLIPSDLARKRLNINRADWDNGEYIQIS